MSTPFNSTYYTNLRNWRTKPTPNLFLGPVIDKIAEQAKRTQRSAGGAFQALDTICPPKLREFVTSTSVRRSVLTLRVPDSAARFELDRWLRCGGQAALIRAAASSIVSVRVSG